MEASHTIIETLKQWDTSLFLFLNGKHNAFFDYLMYLVSYKYTWIPLYMLFLYFLIRNYRKQTFAILIFTAVLITLTDQSSVHLFKNVFQRLRPCHNPDIINSTYTLFLECGGEYGFVSSHAANTFALAVFMILFLGKKIPYFTPLMLFWASLVSYSRIYLGVHYPGDVVGGAIVGVALAFIIGKLYFLLQLKFFSRFTG